MKRTWIVLSSLGALLGAAPAPDGGAADAVASVLIKTDQPGARISPTMYGVFFEDINCGADGGLCPELVKNRSFEFPDNLRGWSEVKEAGAAGSIAIAQEDPVHPANPHYLRLSAAAGSRGYGVANEGFHGMGVQQGKSYVFSAFMRGANAGQAVLRVRLLAADGALLREARLRGVGPGWSKKTAVLQPLRTELKARLQLLLDSPATIDVDMVSLFPRDTWKGRPNGLRADLVQWLADLQPGFVRFPGGCIVEGKTLATRYQWKNTIGDLAERKLIVNRWNDEFKHRPAPDYYQSFGLGFYEYFLLCEDIGAAPLPILNCGMACQFNSGELAPMDQLEPYIQDALDLIEFANGPANSPWGERRAQMGHPAPFNLKLLGVGNEQWGPQYIERYARFAQALKAKYPEVLLVSSAGPRPADDLYRFAWPKLRELEADIVDEHCYDLPAWFFDQAGRYDAFPRTGPKVFMGEYAAQSVKVVSPENRNNLECALAEAAYMTGLERNADVVVMSSYAPLFGHEEGWQWRPNLIWMDNLRSYGTPSYYVQQMFSRNRGDMVLPVQVGGQSAPSSSQPGLYVSAVREQKSGEVILKVVNGGGEARPTAIRLDGAAKVASQGVLTVLTGAHPGDENSLEEPTKVAPARKPLGGLGAEFTHTFPPRSLSVLRIKAGG